MGHETAGVIVDVGAEVTSFSAGQRVTVAPAVPCGECPYCHRGIQTMCDNLRSIGYQFHGGFAEYMVVPASAIQAGCVNAIPDNLSYDEAPSRNRWPASSMVRNCSTWARRTRSRFWARAHRMHARQPGQDPRSAPGDPGGHPAAAIGIGQGFWRRRSDRQQKEELRERFSRKPMGPARPSSSWPRPRAPRRRSRSH